MSNEPDDPSTTGNRQISFDSSMRQLENELNIDDYDGEFEPCPTCGGDGFAEYLDCPEAWGEDCPNLMNHLIRCPNCGGSGDIDDATSF